MHRDTPNAGDGDLHMRARSIRFLPHFLIGIAALSGLPPAVYCEDPPVLPAGSGDSEAEDEVPEPKEPSPAELKFWSAIRLLSSGRTEDIAQGRADLQAAADMEFHHAQFELGRYHLTGAYGFKKDPRKGANLFILAAERGNAFAKAAAGQCFFSGTGVRKNEEKAVRWLEAAIADDADYSRPEPPADNSAQAAEPKVAGALVTDYALSARANSHYLLGLIEQRRKNMEHAHEHFVAAAKTGVDGRDGNYDAARQAALDYAFGQGTARDPEKAKDMLAHSRTLSKRIGVAQIQSWVQSKRLDDFATADVEEALSAVGDSMIGQTQYEIAQMLLDKKSKNYNPRDAAMWFEVAAESGQVWPMMNLALLLGGTELGAPDPVAAFKWWEKAGGGEPAKHSLAAANLAICYQNGIGVEKDAAKAAEIFSRNKHINYLCHLGSQGTAPATVQSYEQAMRLLETAAKNGDSHAQYLMGVRYHGGWDVAIDRDKALFWFKKAAKSGHAGAIRELGKVEQVIPWNRTESGPKMLKRAMDYYRQAADLGDAEAASNLAQMHQTGLGTPVRADLAEEYYRRSLELDPNYAGAHNNLGILYQERLSRGGIDADSVRASMLKCFEEAARLGLPIASANLGRLYSSGELVPRDYEKAYIHFDQAAAAGFAEAHYQLGLMHEFGRGVPVTYTEAAYHYRLAALDGHRLALSRLIESYLSGRGVEVDWDMASFWLIRSVQQGDMSSLVTLADVQLKRGETKDAVKLFRILADHPNPLLSGFGCERLSICYELGAGVNASPARAKRYFDRAVEKGSGDALARLSQIHFANNRTAEGVEVMKRAAETSAVASYYLGQMYFFGTHVEKDLAKAIELMRKASRSNHPKAMFFLAAAAYNRVPEAPDIDEAIRLAESAEKMGVPEAAGLREKLERRRDRAQENAEQVARARSG